MRRVSSSSPTSVSSPCRTSTKCPCPSSPQSFSCEIPSLRDLAGSLFSMASALSRLQLDHRQLAVISALFLFNPEHLAEVPPLPLFKCQHEGLMVVHESLWGQLRQLNEESASSDDEGLSPPAAAARRWPRLISRLARLRGLSQELRAVFSPTHFRFFRHILGH